MASTQYLNFSIDQIKQAIILRLNAGGSYTDQLYEGSNLMVFIDIFSYMFANLMYSTNFNAAESMFTDAQFYEDINRIVKFLGYNPRGFITSKVQTILTNKGKGGEILKDDMYVIPRFSTINAESSDSKGVDIKYTFIEDYPFIVNGGTIDSDYSPTLFNGEWKLYNQIFKSVGIPNENYTLVLLNLSSGDDMVYVSHDNMYIYVNDPDNGFQEWTFTSDISSALATDLVFSLRLNENKQYVITFGNNVNGKRIPANADLYVVYLQSNGPDGEISAETFPDKSALITQIAGLDELFIYNNVLKMDENTDYLNNSYLQYLGLENPNVSTLTQAMEGVEDIRENAPNFFRTGNRLITTQDFTQYIMDNYSNVIYDVQVMNNWKYMTNFFHWLYQFEKLNPDIIHYNYKYTDSCDYNNVYFFLKSFSNDNVSDAIKDSINRDCDMRKPLTSELVPVDPFLVTFTPYLDGRSLDKKDDHYPYNTTNFDALNENKILVIRDKNSMITLERIQQRVVSAIQTFFSLESCNLGMQLKINDLYNQLCGIDGVLTVKMKYLKSGADPGTTTYFNGLSFANWTNYLIDGADFNRITGIIKIRDFQFPILLDPMELVNKIECVNEEFSPITEY